MVGAVVTVVVAVLFIAVWLGQRSLIYLPDRSTPPPAAEVVPGAHDVTLHTADGLTLAAWYLPPSGPCRAAVLVAHGNGGNRAGRAELARALGERGFGVLLPDYRGYGGNPGSPSAAGLAQDVRVARTFLLEDGGIAPDRLVYLGESLGTGVVSELAAEHPPAALVLRSPFTSFGDVVRSLYGVPLGPLLRDRYPVVEHVRGLDVPLAVVLGDADTLVPPEQSRAVARAAGTDAVVVEVPGAGHNDPVLAHGPALVEALVEVAGRGGVTGCG